jgi:predicted dehydrogenase
MTARLGVGFVGAGPVTQAVHLPTLTRVSDLFEVVEVMDADLSVAKVVAARVGAKATSSVSAVLENPEVDVVAICSPNRFHAEQTIAACRAGKKAVLCEKPVTLSVIEAEEVEATSRETGVPVVVGTMHTFDRAWRQARESWGEPAGSVHAIRSSIVLPPNRRMEDMATEVSGRLGVPEPDFSSADVQAAIVYRALMGVAIHNLPHVRAFLPAEGELTILSCACLPPFGYHVLARYGECRIEWHCRMYGTWRPDWVFEAFGHDRVLRLEFTPSYVQAGSALASVRTVSGLTTFRAALVNGYVEEWRELALLALRRAPRPDLTTVVADLRFALGLADSAVAFIRDKESRP